MTTEDNEGQGKRGGRRGKSKGKGRKPKDSKPESKNSELKWGKPKLRNLVSPNTKRLRVDDPVESHNICCRANYETQPFLLRFKSQRQCSKSHLASTMLRELMDGLRNERDPMTLVEMQVYGEKRGINVPDKEGGQWQAHDPVVVERVKVMEQAHNLSRKVIGRAAIVRFIEKHRHELQ